MTTHSSIALFRGINVGGNNLLPMKELVRDLESIGLENVRTYIQSGNVVFESSRKPSAALAKKIAATIDERHGFEPQVLLLGASDLQSAIDGNPFPEAESEPKTLHVLFLTGPARSPDLTAIEESKSAKERFELRGRVFYLHAPDGIGRSKLAGKAEKFLGVSGTGRNWRTVEALAKMIDL